MAKTLSRAIVDQNQHKVSSGWQCPVCGVVYAPWVAQCSNPHVKSGTANTTHTFGRQETHTEVRDE